jgi:hypothetical protein
MSMMYANLGLAAWLLVSAFVLRQPALGGAVTAVLALAMGTASALSHRRPALRLASAGVALALVFLAVLWPGLGAAARISDLVVGLIVLALSAASPGHRRASTAEAHAGAGAGPPA